MARVTRMKPQDEKVLMDGLSALPAKLYQRLSGRDAKQLRTQSERYGIPFSGSPVDVGAVLRSFHDFLSAVGPVARRLDKQLTDDDPLLSGPASPSLERYRAARATSAEIDLAERLGTLCDTKTLASSRGAVVTALKGCIETLDRDFGPAAGKIVRTALGTVQREQQRLLDGMREGTGNE